MNRINIVSELAFAQALADQLLPKLQNGRLKSLLLKLSNATINEVQKLKKIRFNERKEAAQMIMQFAELTKWEGKTLHICTKINFMLSLYEDKPHGNKLIPILNEIYDYFARAKDAPKACEWSAALASDKWEEIKKNANSNK